MSSTQNLSEKLANINSGTDAWLRIIAYFILFSLSLVGNCCAILSLCQRRRNYPFTSSLNALLIHLCIADLVVTFFYIGVEVIWRISIGWFVGNMSCKFVQFFRAFGFYLSSFVIMCISLDRYKAVVYPLKLRSTDTSARLKCCWILAAVFATPQGCKFICRFSSTVLCINYHPISRLLAIFNVETHPNYSWFKQCQTMWMGETAEKMNTALSLIIVYFAPLLVIFFSYGNLLCTLFHQRVRSPEHQSLVSRLRIHGHSLVEKAKIHSLKLTVMIVVSFLVCWTPYVVITLWHMLNRKSAENLDVRLQDFLFLVICFTPAVNSLVYGIFSSSDSTNLTTQDETSTAV